MYLFHNSPFSHTCTFYSCTFPTPITSPTPVSTPTPILANTCACPIPVLSCTLYLSNTESAHNCTFSIPVPFLIHGSSTPVSAPHLSLFPHLYLLTPYSFPHLYLPHHYSFSHTCTCFTLILSSPAPISVLTILHLALASHLYCSTSVSHLPWYFHLCNPEYHH